MKQKFDDEWRIREGLWEATTKVVNDAYERKSGNWGIVSNLTGAERDYLGLNQEWR